MGLPRPTTSVRTRYWRTNLAWFGLGMPLAGAALFVSPVFVIVILFLGFGLGIYGANIRCPNCLDRPFAHRPHMFYRAFKFPVPPFCPYCGYDCHLPGRADRRGTPASPTAPVGRGGD